MRVMMGAACRREYLATSLVVLLAAACSGDGSDIGPRLARLPDDSSKVQLLDDDNRAVVAGTVSVAGTSFRAVTGSNGRGDFLATPRGRLLVRADGSSGAATAGDRLADLQVAMTVIGSDLPAPIHLPALPDTASATLQTGVPSVTASITSAGGTIVTVGAGVTINSAPSIPITIRVGDLSPQHLPGDLPFAGSLTNLFGRGVFVHPADAVFSPGLDLDVFDDLGLGANGAVLYRLDHDTGEWLSVGSATAIGDRIQLVGGLTRGGLYAFGAGVGDRTVAGRVLDVAGNPVRDAMVRVDHRDGLSSADGRFSIDFVPATFADGSPRSAVIELFAGGSWMPAVTSTTQPLAGTVAGEVVDAGDLVLDTVLVGNLRVQQVVRARSDPFQPSRCSSVDTAVAYYSSSDANGQLIFEDLPIGFYGLQEARRRNSTEVFYGRSVGFLQGDRRWADFYQFLFGRGWFLGARSNTVYVCDAVGSGPIRDAAVVQGAGAGAGFVALTRENGLVFGDRQFGGRATATLRSERNGRSVTHAFTIEQPASDHLELPMQRVLRTPFGGFDRHGLVAGNLTGASASQMHSIRVTRRLTLQEWWDNVVEAVPIESRLPIDVDPAATHLAFQVGMDAIGGHLAAIEYTAAASNALEKVGLLTDYVPVEGGVTSQDVPLDNVANATFAVTGAAAGVSADVDLATLQLALGLLQSNGNLVDVARDLGGSVSVNGEDLGLRLPPLTGDLSGGQWLALLSGSTVSGGTTSKHYSWLSLTQPVTAGFAFPEFPDLVSPAPGASVSADGFVASFTLPPGAVGGVLELRSQLGQDLLLWQAVVPPDVQEFSFVSLPVEANSPLVAGRTYVLTLTAWFGTIDIASPDVFGDFVSFWQSVGIAEAGVNRISRRSITITAQ